METSVKTSRVRPIIIDFCDISTVWTVLFEVEEDQQKNGMFQHIVNLQKNRIFSKKKTLAKMFLNHLIGRMYCEIFPSNCLLF